MLPMFVFGYLAPFQNASGLKVSGVENLGQISHVLTPRKNYGRDELYE